MKLIELGDKFMIAFLIMVMSGGLLIISMYRHEHVDAVLALIGAWWGGIITYYFTSKGGKESEKK